MKGIRAFAILTLPLTGIAAHHPAQVHHRHPSAATVSARLQSQLTSLPLSFEVNRGQAARQTRFLAHGFGYGLSFGNGGATLSLALTCTRVPSRIELIVRPVIPRPRGCVTRRVRLTPDGGNAHAVLRGVHPLRGKVNYFIGKNPRHWHTDIPTYAGVLYRDIYRHTDLTYYGASGRLEYDWVLHPGADPGAIRLDIHGATVVRADGQGNLVLKDGSLMLRQDAPLIYQKVGSHRRWVQGRYIVHGAGQIGFALGRYDRSRPLVIDPILEYSTYLGGGAVDEGFGIALDGQGHAFITGDSNSADFPTRNSIEPFRGGSALGSDAFVAELDTSGRSLMYSTYLGGTGFDYGYAIAVDSTGAAYVGGETLSADFPTVRAFQQKSGGGGDDGFAAKLSPAGDRLIYSSYVGGSSDDACSSLAIDATGAAYLTGYTRSKDFPIRNAFDAVNHGTQKEAFVTKITASGQLGYSTYLGGNGEDVGSGIAVDREGSAYVTGLTSSPNFPLAHPIQATFHGGAVAFVTKLNPAGTALAYSTFLGGRGINAGFGVAVDASGQAYVTGITNSAHFPHVHAAQMTYGGDDGDVLNGDAFVSKLNRAGTALLFSTYLGGKRDDWGNGVAVGQGGNVVVTGQTNSFDFPIRNAIQHTFVGATCHDMSGRAFPCSDAFVVELSGAGALRYSTFLAGSADDSGSSVAIDRAGSVYVIGNTNSSNFPTQSPVQSRNHSTDGMGTDAFVAKIFEPKPNRGLSRGRRPGPELAS